MREKTIGGGDLGSTVREFDYRRQRIRLFVNSSFQLLVTIALCAALAGALYGFSTVVTGLSQPQKKGFNALITGLSIVLGLNLASSLKGYAQMMRWRFLASGYRTLQDFELVMQCESQSKVFKLLWAGRTRGQRYPNKTQVLAFTWLGINVALQVVTALLGLTYSINISDKYTHLLRGSLGVADLQTLTLPTSTDDSFSVQASVANNFGVTGETYGNSTSTRKCSSKPVSAWLEPLLLALSQTASQTPIIKTLSTSLTALSPSLLDLLIQPSSTDRIQSMPTKVKTNSTIKTRI